MPVDPVSQTLVNAILQDTLKQDEKQRKSGYWMLCPSCGKRVVKKQLIKRGCFSCTWRGTEEEIKKAQDEQMNQLIKSRKAALSVKIENLYSFRTNCFNCGGQVITEEFKKKGCYICGWKPK